MQNKINKLVIFLLCFFMFFSIFSLETKASVLGVIDTKIVSNYAQKNTLVKAGTSLTGKQVASIGILGVIGSITLAEEIPKTLTFLLDLANKTANKEDLKIDFNEIDSTPQNLYENELILDSVYNYADANTKGVKYTKTYNLENYNLNFIAGSLYIQLYNNNFVTEVWRDMEITLWRTEDYRYSVYYNREIKVNSITFTNVTGGNLDFLLNFETLDDNTTHTYSGTTSFAYPITWEKNDEFLGLKVKKSTTTVTDIANIQEIYENLKTKNTVVDATSGKIGTIEIGKELTQDITIDNVQEVTTSTDTPTTTIPILGDIWNILKNIAQTLLDFFTTVKTFILSFFTNITNAISNIFSNIISTTKNFVDSFWTTLTDTAVDLFVPTISFTDAIDMEKIEQGKDFLDKIKNVIFFLVDIEPKLPIFTIDFNISNLNIYYIIDFANMFTFLTEEHWFIIRSVFSSLLLFSTIRYILYTISKE